MAVQVHQFICLSDNFGLLLHDDATGATACVDAPDGAALVAELKRLGWGLTHILLTHHHLDHVEGTPELKQAFPQALVVGAKRDAGRLPPLDVAVSEGDHVMVGKARARVLETPGHTLGHLAYHFDEDAIVFVGDTLFSLGCGRVFEGTMEQMATSLDRLAELPGETRVYCGHEYTQANGRFAITVDADNVLLVDRIREVEALRSRGDYTLPTTIALECATNPFLRSEAPEIGQAIGLPDAGPVDVFARLRAMKNEFRG